MKKDFRDGAVTASLALLAQHGVEQLPSGLISFCLRADEEGKSLFSTLWFTTIGLAALGLTCVIGSAILAFVHADHLSVAAFLLTCGAISLTACGLHPRPFVRRIVQKRVAITPRLEDP